MKTDLYTKIVLTAIAVFLGVIALKNETIFTTAHASTNTNNINTRLATVPINEDGSINVRVSDVIDVNIEEVDGGSLSFGGVPVVIKYNNDK